MSEQDYYPRGWNDDRWDTTKRYPPRPYRPPANEGKIKVVPDGVRVYGPFDIGRQLPYRG